MARQGIPEFWVAEEKKASLLTYALCRLEKINNEREYCFRYFSSVAPIREVEARFCITQQGKKIPGYESASIQLRGGGVGVEGYPKIKIVQAFLNQHPKWEVGAIEGAIKS